MKDKTVPPIKPPREDGKYYEGPKRGMPGPSKPPSSAPNVSAKNPWLHDLLKRRKPHGFVGE